MNPNRHLMLAFEGDSIPDWLRQTLAEAPPAGVTLFRELNMESPDQVGALVRQLQETNSEDLPLLVAVDQEGGQLQGLVGSTPFAGNMALGAAGDTELTFRVAEAMGRELASVGINFNYAPVADIATRPHNPSLGVRSFGENPEAVSAHVAAAVEGYRSAGVVCTLKHFPGKGEAVVDPHFELPRMDLDRERLDLVELAPFVAGIAASAGALMTGHYSVPALTGSEELPVSMSARAVEGFIRSDLGFDGLVITDALDMGALDQGAGQVVDLIASLTGGTDLLLCMPDPELRERVRLAVDRGSSRGLIPDDTLNRSTARINAARASLVATDIEPGVVGSHNELAADLAQAALTLVRDEDGLLPLALESSERVLVLEPEPTNVTPADTTVLYDPALATAVRAQHPEVNGIVYPYQPGPADIAGLVEAAITHDAVIVGTVNATSGQTDLVRQLAGTGIRLVTVALREPQDLAKYPEVSTHVCTYSSHAPSMTAAAMAMFGKLRFPGRLPVTIPGLYPIGHGA